MFELAFKNIDTVLWDGAGCVSDLDPLEQSFWVCFLKYYEALNCGIFA